jgi:SAM-dependent methyltransferase
MSQTPAHELHNPDLLALIPPDLKVLLEIGCSSGALARELKKVNPNCRYIGLEISEDYAQLARRYCDEVLIGNIELMEDGFWVNSADAQCWIFGDVLEHLHNPWLCLKRIYDILPLNGYVLACIPNVQHWSIPVNISLGNFKYQEEGLLDQSHLRWFTRKTIIELFHGAGFEIELLRPRIFDEPLRENFLDIIQELAIRAGGDASQARSDALPLQYLVRAKKAEK